MDLIVTNTIVSFISTIKLIIITFTRTYPGYIMAHVLDFLTSGVRAQALALKLPQ